MNRKKFTIGTLIFAGACLSALVSVLLINLYVKSSVNDAIITAEEAAYLDVDCIVIMGAGVWGETPSHMLEDRLLQGIDLYEKGASDRILMSGDHGSKEYDEVNVMKKFAVDKGIVSEHVFMDHAGFDTYSSLYRARDIFQAQRMIIVTQKYHLYRALYIAKSMGIEAYGVSSDPRQYGGQDMRDARETLARVKDFFKVMIKPKPTYLGETIPVNGNGDLTND